VPPLIPEFKKDADKRLLSCPGEEAALRPAFLIVDVTVLDMPKTDLNAHVLGVPAASVALWDMMESSSMGEESMPPTPSFSCRSSSSSLPTVLLKSSSSSSGSTYGDEGSESLPLSPSSVSTIESPSSRFLPLKEDCGSSTTRCTALLLDLAAPPELLSFFACGARSPAGVFFEPAPSSFPLCDLEAGHACAVSRPHHACKNHAKQSREQLA